MFHESDDLIVETPLREAVHFGVAVRKLSDLQEPRHKLGVLRNRAWNMEVQWLGAYNQMSLHRMPASYVHASTTHISFTVFFLFVQRQWPK